jgi:hypothetical protein
MNTSEDIVCSLELCVEYLRAMNSETDEAIELVAEINHQIKQCRAIGSEIVLGLAQIKHELASANYVESKPGEYCNLWRR